MEYLEKINTAKRAIEKDYTYEDVCYSDDFYDESNKDELIDQIWDLILECKEIGIVQWEHKYKIE